MNSLKFKVGDTVRVRPDLKRWDNYTNNGSLGANQYMYDLAGKVVTITKKVHSSVIKLPSYKINADDEQWYWIDEFFEDYKVESTTRKGVKL